MNSVLKQDMRDAGICVSEGDELQVFDLQLARDFLHFGGYSIGENFHLYEEAKAARGGAPEVGTNAADEAAEAARLQAEQEAEIERIKAEQAAAEAARLQAEQDEAARLQAEQEAAAKAEAERLQAEQDAASKE